MNRSINVFIIILLFLATSLLVGCRKKHSDDSTVSTGTICFWTSYPSGGYKNVYIDDVHVGTITKSFSTTPGFGASGTVTATRPYGTYSYRVKASTSSAFWLGTFTLSDSRRLIMLQLTETQLPDEPVVAVDTTCVHIRNSDLILGPPGADAPVVQEVPVSDKPVISIYPPTAEAYEGDEPLFIEIRSSKRLSKNLDIIFYSSGSALEGSDFEFMQAVITIPAGKDSAWLMMTTKEDDVKEGEETAIIKLSAQDSYMVSDKEGEIAVLIKEP